MGSRRLRAPCALVAVVLAAGVGCANLRVSFHHKGVDVHTIRIEHNNAHVVVVHPRRGGPPKVFLVDAGLYRDRGKLLAHLRALGIAPRSLRLVVLTHGHADHAGGAVTLQRRHRVPVVAGAGDAPMLAKGRNGRLCPVGAVARWMVDKHQGERYPPLRPELLVGDRPLDLSGKFQIDAEVRPMPGHTPGSVVLEITHAKIAFVGDMFRGGILAPNWATTHLYHCDLRQNLHNIYNLLRKSSAEIFYTGHFGPIPRRRVEVLYHALRRRVRRGDVETW